MDHTLKEAQDLIKDAAKVLREAADKQLQAGDTQLTAAKTPKVIVVDVNVKPVTPETNPGG